MPLYDTHNAVAVNVRAGLKQRFDPALGWIQGFSKAGRHVTGLVDTSDLKIYTLDQDLKRRGAE